MDADVAGIGLYVAMLVVIKADGKAGVTVAYVILVERKRLVMIAVDDEKVTLDGGVT